MDYQKDLKIIERNIRLSAKLSAIGLLMLTMAFLIENLNLTFSTKLFLFDITLSVIIYISCFKFTDS